MFERYENETFPIREERIAEFWEKNNIFEKSVDSRKDNPLFSFYDGPPFATGLPHYGHILPGTIKDLIPRYKTMKGYYVPRRFGWDCHGLPVENEIEKAKQLSGALEIEKFGIANFNEECRKIVLRYTEEWKKIVFRFGRWVDFNNTYKTMDITFMESVWWVFKELWKKDLIYEGFKVMPFSAQLGTPLSNFEANLNYREVEDPSITVAFESSEEKENYFLAWTTTPWTLISNLALTVKEDLDYVKVKDLSSNKNYILAKERVKFYFKDNFEIVKKYKGKDLVDKRYIPLFPYFEDRRKNGAFRIISAEYISTEEGTGIVHTAPAFGEQDFFTCQKAKIDIVCPIDANGRFTHEAPDFEGVLVKDADNKIISILKEKGNIFKIGKVKHRYPFCWRSDTPLIYKAVTTWFVSVEEIKDVIIASNEQIYWVPAHIKYGRFGKWLENARDWAISRNRYWGTPIPIWKSEKGKMVIFGSIKELEDRVKVKIKDLHRHYIDDITFTFEGEKYKRIEEVFDCWFESGSMPYAQNHYPFENKEQTEKAFPADFIAEGLDQTRGWFYTLNVLSSALFKKPAFKNVVVNGIVLAEDGTKMSKRLKNYPEPTEIINHFGADAMRLYLMNSPAVKGEDLCFSSKGVELILRQALIPLWNSYLFLSTYSKIYKWTPKILDFKKPQSNIDRWILSVLQKLIFEVDRNLEKYDLNKAVEALIHFIDRLTNWYIRRSRARFWQDEDTLDRREAFETLYRVLLTFIKVAAPFIPFITEAIYLELKTKEMKESVHLCDFPNLLDQLIDKSLEEEMRLTQKVVSLGHFLRKKEKLKVRQPLCKAYIVCKDKELLKNLKKQRDLILEELNVKKIEFLEEDTEFVKLNIKPNFKILGKRVGELMPKVKDKIVKFDQDKIKAVEKNNVVIEIDNKKIEISPRDVEVKRVAKEGFIATSEDNLTIALDIQLTKDLILEGIAREIVNKINSMRKEHNFEVTDRIKVIFDTTDLVKKSFEKHKKYILGEILAVDVKFEKCVGTTLDLNGEITSIFIKKV
ncbi:MAG: isoleucyl-tRNA synthase [Chlamydiae bacterium SM23_39]|nr:MAG: isoleucyl-tRNA synthase [Chlamydiae bacterium SM23_39]